MGVKVSGAFGVAVGAKSKRSEKWSAVEWIWIVAMECLEWSVWRGVDVESKWSWIGVVGESWRLEVEEGRTSWLNTLRHVKAMSEKGIWALEVRRDCNLRGGTGTGGTGTQLVN